VAGNPAAFGAPGPDHDILLAGISLCQDYLAQIADGSIVCRPQIAAIDGRTVIFADGSHDDVDAMVCATGYAVDIPYLHPDLWDLLSGDLALYHRTLHPDLPGFGVIGQFLAQGPYFPLLELQARWIVAIWAGDIAAPEEAAMRRVIAEPRPAIDVHNVLATTLAEASGVAPDLLARPELTEALLFGPLLPPRYRLDGPGARADASRLLSEQFAASPRAPVEAADIEALDGLGLGPAADLLRRSAARDAAPSAAP